VILVQARIAWAARLGERMRRIVIFMKPASDDPEE
jgi:hypothetical protein